MDTSILKIAEVFQKAAIETIARSCHVAVTVSKTAQLIPAVEISKQVGSFVSFTGNYNGLMVINFEGETALELVSASLRAMGMPESEIPGHALADDVLSSIGELTNHIVGKARNSMQQKYDLVARSNIPAVVPVTTPIGLVFKGGGLEESECVRLSFRTPNNNQFHMEICSEPAQFVELGK